MSNLALWNDVRIPVKGSLKKVTTRGGFTSINAQHQIEYATEKFGPLGSTWGMKDLDWGLIHGADGAPLQLTLDAVFYYPSYTGAGGDVSQAGSFEIGSDIEWTARGECRKKLRTDLMTKALSQIGFSSDVFKNMWDGDRYMGKDEESGVQPVKITGPNKDEAFKLIEGAKSLGQIKKVAGSCKGRALAEGWLDDLNGLYKMRADELGGSK